MRTTPNNRGSKLPAPYLTDNRRAVLLTQYLEGRVNKNDLFKLNAEKLIELVPALDQIVQLHERFNYLWPADVVNPPFDLQRPPEEIYTERLSFQEEFLAAHRECIAAFERLFPKIVGKPHTHGRDWLDKEGHDLLGLLRNLTDKMQSTNAHSR